MKEKVFKHAAQLLGGLEGGSGKVRRAQAPTRTAERNPSAQRQAGAIHTALHSCRQHRQQAANIRIGRTTNRARQTDKYGDGQTSRLAAPPGDRMPNSGGNQQQSDKQVGIRLPTLSFAPTPLPRAPILSAIMHAGPALLCERGGA